MLNANHAILCNEKYVQCYTYTIPPGSLMALVLKLQWAPAPLQSPAITLGFSVTFKPKSSATRCRR